MYEGYFLLKIITRNTREDQRNIQKGKTIKEKLLKATCITASIVIKAGSFFLNQDVFEAHKETEKDKRRVLIEKLRNEEEKYKKYVKASTKM